MSIICISVLYLSVHLLGVDMSSMHQMKTQRSSTMLSDVRQLVSGGGSVNQQNDDGVTLVRKYMNLKTVCVMCTDGDLNWKAFGQMKHHV